MGEGSVGYLGNKQPISICFLNKTRILSCLKNPLLHFLCHSILNAVNPDLLQVTIFRPHPFEEWTRTNDWPVFTLLQ
jgi:hypothetical protein